MPMPAPQAGEGQDDFMSRCMSEQASHFDSQDQAVAACMTAWRGESAQARSIMPHLVYTKSRGAWQQQILVDKDLCDWFRDHIDSKGVVQEPILLYEKADIKPVEGGYLWTLSDFSVDRDQERIDPRGWDLSFYRRLPIVLWSHDYSRPAIGVAQDLQINADSLTGKIKFSAKEVDEFAGMIEDKVKEGIIKAGSVGFMSNKVELVNEEGNPTRLIHRLQTLIEFSVCNIPTNVNAMMQPSLELSRSVKVSKEEITSALDGLLPAGPEKESYIAKLLKQEGRKPSDLKTLLEKQGARA